MTGRSCAAGITTPQCVAHPECAGRNGTATHTKSLCCATCLLAWQKKSQALDQLVSQKSWRSAVSISEDSSKFIQSSLVHLLAAKFEKVPSADLPAAFHAISIQKEVMGVSVLRGQLDRLLRAKCFLCPTCKEWQANDIQKLCGSHHDPQCVAHPGCAGRNGTATHTKSLCCAT
ncbi:unnamed protein product [Polarella glacialis]|uniref:Uncharacterized protein n=1 Tax=Polarella glacialis TaxID=89957 RepID=A0A813K7A4_POLGL|nr:unnamed protein product [Polarella glacialis]